jgi:hypothetical protein
MHRDFQCMEIALPLAWKSLLNLDLTNDESGVYSVIKQVHRKEKPSEQS